MLRALSLVFLLVAITADAYPRSQAVRAEFKRLNPCPTNGATRGPCPGWEIDHIQPLKCGGPDEVGNMQWLTIADHKAKTKAEAKLCRPPRKNANAALPGPARHRPVA